MTKTYQTISVIGLGYVGLPTAATLASRGVTVIGVDVAKSVVDRINEGLTHIVEPDLDMMVRTVVQSGNLRAVLKPQAADAFLIAVPTPILEDNSPDMRAVRSATAAIAPVLKAGDLIIIESTSPVGTTEAAAQQIRQLRPDLTTPLEAPEESDLLIAYCPERVLPGRTLRELVDNARLVGGLDQRSALAAKALYEIFAKGEIIPTRAREAEMSKLTENAFRDVNIAFANELSLACDALGVDVWTVIKHANLHPRVNILAPGPGVGGHCIPIDPWFIHHAAPAQTPLIRTAREVNLGKTGWVVAQVTAKAARFAKPKIAVLGLAYKPDIDDLRESPAIHVVESLAKSGVGEVLAVEPHIDALPPELKGVDCVRLLALADALAQADVVVGLVPHKAFSAITPAMLREKAILDTVGMLPV